MGWFSRKDSESETGRRSSGRGQRALDDDTHALRQRARHRLIGALALVLAAIIVVPMLIGTEPNAPAPVPQVVQANIPPLPEPITPDTGMQAAASGQVDTTPPVDSPLPAPTPVPEQPPAPVPPAASTSTPPVSPPPAPPKPEPEPSKPAAPEKPAAGNRTDDGAVALALLEGRSAEKPASPPPAAAARGNFVLQIVALSSDAEAQNRRAQLVAAGVTNAYVESASSGGKATYRLRVGPFPTREAAQAAQTRLRALGYDNSFISSK
ncbi:SPOR domain-containing protein [Pusillimonas sp. CC-YST705]|uniref:SPOR domain-containing protein n=1 Tax=Mesopusillimonas faecipullorum TaxID=2755040 RepID=A0ABS8CAU1_9BURK|nr:SPOR domain-containing protein [Mesopusillimonas faecipullorum]MCB5363145.1 SPOR domain-containing protein [Mesopusillimonas faecipullorum]